MHRPGIARTIGLLVISVFVVALFLYAMLGSTVGRPSEANRVKHPSGFSGIGPANWTPVITYTTNDGKGSDSVYFAPAKTEGRPISITYTRLPAADEANLIANGYAAETIAGRRVLHLQTVKRDRKDIFLCKLGEQWFEVLTLRHIGDHDDARWREYVATLRVEAAATTTRGVIAPNG